MESAVGDESSGVAERSGPVKHQRGVGAHTDRSVASQARRSQV
jgi:hypothetical protein